MPVTRLNHAVLYVRDVDRSVAFYSDVLGFRRLPVDIDGAAFLRAPASTNDHDLGLFQIGSGAGPSPAGRSTVGLYHLAWEVDTLDELDRLSRLLAEHGALVGTGDHGTTKSLYARDPDGIELEVAWIVPAELAGDQAAAGGGRVRMLDIDRERQRYGGSTAGGIGASITSDA